MNNTSEYLSDTKTFHGIIPLVMGTRLEMLIFDTDKDTAVPLWDWLCVEAEHLGSILNRYDAQSEVTRLNCAIAPMRISSTLADVIRTSLRYSERTLSLFDISKGHYREIEISPENVAFTHGHPLDFGGIAKGYLLNKLHEKCVASGIKCAFVDFGSSSILAIGHHPYGDCWKVGVQNPFGHETIMDVELKDQSMSTSGNTTKHSLHIIDPRTGKPNNEKKAITVISENALDAEVVSTTLMLADDQQKAYILKHFPDLTEKTFIIK